MKTPDEINNGLEHCAQSEPCVDCVYDRRDFPMCVRRMEGDALAYIQQLEAAHRTEYCEDADYDCKRLGDARKRIQQLEKHIGELTEKVAQIKAEQQNLICDFMDYINDGVQNPAPYCAFGENCVLVDKRGWCRPGEHGCNGFVPKVRDDNENA